jgi:ubiquinone/menaquinone biosynthesis C-methylase UbiE
MDSFLWDLVDVSGVKYVLSVGFGHGAEIQKLCEKLNSEATIFGVDINHKTVEEAKIRFLGLDQKLVVRIGDAVDLPFQDESMDLVFCRLVLSEIVDWKKAVSEMTRVTRFGGRIIVIDFHTYNVEWQVRSGDAHPGLETAEIMDELVSNECRIIQFKPMIGRGTIGSLDGNRLWVNTFFIEGEKV